MYPSHSRILLALAVVWMTAAVAVASPVQPRHEKAVLEQGVDASPADPCRSALGKDATPTVASWRARIDRRAAIHVVDHVRRACRLMVKGGNGDAKFAELAELLRPVLADLQTNVLAPIYRSHPELEATSLAGSRLQNINPGSAAKRRPSRAYRATRRDIRRATAVRLNSELHRIQQQALKLASTHADEAATSEAALSMLQPITDAAAELSFASQVAYDAYPDLFKKLFEEVPHQPRTEESDASFRKSAPPRGSVKLSAAALRFVKVFMRQAQSLAPRDVQVAAISWARDQKRKGPNDVAWIDEGPGWVFGAYFRTQLPPDVIDKIGGIEIVFGAEDPASLAGKTLDIKDRKFFVRD